MLSKFFTKLSQFLLFILDLHFAFLNYHQFLTKQSEKNEKKRKNSNFLK